MPGTIIFDTDYANSTSITSGALPAGLTGTWSSPIYRIKGTVNTGVIAKAYQFTVTASSQHGCSEVSTTGTIVVQPLPAVMPPAASTQTWTYGTLTYSDRVTAQPIAPNLQHCHPAQPLHIR
jgi:hypothetical protein